MLDAFKMGTMKMISFLYNAVLREWKKMVMMGLEGNVENAG